MDKKLLDRYLKLTGAENDPDAVMGLRGAQSLFASEGASLENALRYAAEHLEEWRGSQMIDNQSEKSAVPAVVNMTGVPECRASRAGELEIVAPGKSEGDVYPLPGESAAHAETIAVSLKDAVVAAVVNKSRFKLKMLDVKDSKGKILETILQAEYERPGMTPVRIWVLSNRGEVGALATVLRKAVANSLPELVAA